MAYIKKIKLPSGASLDIMGTTYIDTADNWSSSSLTLKKGELAVKYNPTNGTAELCVAKEDNVTPFHITKTERFPNFAWVNTLAENRFDDKIEPYSTKIDALYELNDTPLNHNGIYRGKNLTNVYSPDDIQDMIADGTFSDLYLGDYFDLTLSDNKKCRLEVAHFNYYKDRGINDPHVVFIVGYTSDGYAGTVTGTNGTAGKTTGYYNSTIHMTTLPAWVNKVETALGYSLTTVAERLSSAINTSINSMLRQPNGSSMTGCVSAMTWDAPKALLPNSMQVYGESICSNTISEMGLSTEKFALFNYETFWFGNAISDITGATTAATTSIWLRDIAGDGYLVADVLGKPARRGVDAAAMLRPYVIIS